MNNSNNDVKKISLWVKLFAAFAALCISIGGVFYEAETRYAKAATQEKNAIAIVMNSRQIEVMRTETYLRRMLERVWMLEKQYGFGCQSCPPEYRQEYLKLKFEIDRMTKRLNQLEGK